jgi:alpha-soluble NSF attachment protein
MGPIAGSCYKKSSPTEAVTAYQSAISLLTDAGRLTNAAKLCKECAELFENEEASVQEQEKSSIVQAIEFYNQASDLFSMEDSHSQSSSCLAKVAELCSGALDPPDLLRAANIYDTIGRKCLESNLLKFNAKGYFFQAILCHLAAGDAIAATQNLDRYEGIDYTFGESREGKFCRTICTCIENYDMDTFGQSCFEYDRISKLDPWKTSMLVKIKRTIGDDGLGGGDSGADGDDDVDLT